MRFNWARVCVVRRPLCPLDLHDRLLALVLLGGDDLNDLFGCVAVQEVPDLLYDRFW